MEKRNRFIWFLYACILCLCFSVVTASLTRLMGLPVQFYFLLTAVAAAAALVGIYLPVRLAAVKCRPGTEWMYSGKKGVFPSFFLPAALTVLLVCMRLFFSPEGISPQSQFCYQRAVLGTKLLLPLSGELYAFTLRAVLGFFPGERAVFWLNLALQAAGLVLFYTGIRRREGAFCAVTACLAVIFTSPFADSIAAAEPQSLVFFLAAFLIWLGTLPFLEKGRPRKVQAFFLVFSGLLYGMGILVAPVLSAAFLFWLAVAVSGFQLKQTKGLVVAASVCGAVCGFFALFMICVLADAGTEGLSVSAGKLLWSWQDLTAGRITDSILHSPSLKDYWMTFPLFVPALFALFGPLQQPGHKNGSFAAWTVLLGAVAFWETLSQAPLQEQGLRFAVLGVFSGMGIRNLFFVPDGFDLQPVPKKTGDSKGPDAKEDSRDNREISAPAPGEYLDNPLPVPKRHRKREMDYGFEPRQDQMYYEIPVADNDDFDLKE